MGKRRKLPAKGDEFPTSTEAAARLGPNIRRVAELYWREVNQGSPLWGERRKAFIALCQMRIGDTSFTDETLTKWMKRPGFRTYVKALDVEARDGAIVRLQAEAHDVVDDYITARKAAKAAGDYKELRLATQDHLDRIGATLKPPDNQVQVATIVVRSRNVDLNDATAALPAVEAEVLD